MIMPDNGTGSISQRASDLAKYLEVELRGLEPLASCMPCLTNPSGMVRGGQDGAGQSQFLVWHGLESTGVGWTRSHLVSHWFPASAHEVRQHASQDQQQFPFAFQHGLPFRSRCVTRHSP